MASRTPTFLLAAPLLAALALPAVAEAPSARIALVVGNGGYRSVGALPNALRDAEHIGQMFADLGYTVIKGMDLDRLGFEGLLRETMLNIPEGAEVVFYYAGHGVQIGARNYLLPTDAVLGAPEELPVYSITLDRVIENLAARGALHVAIIDACRDNPFFGQGFATGRDATLYESRSGFEPFRTPLNSLIAFATSPGAQAWEGDIDGNSPYTAALVSEVRAAPGGEVMAVLAKVRQQVYRTTGGAQIPWESSTLVSPFTFGDSDGALLPAAVAGAEGDAGPEIAGGGDAAAPGSITRSAQAELALAVPLERFVRLDDRLAEIAALVAPELVEAPRHGQLGIFEDGFIYYRPKLQEIAAVQQPDYRLTDRLGIETGPPEARMRVTVELSLTPEPCDLLAGDRLDLQGTGLYRYANDIDPAAAALACTAAHERAPDVPRFLYQLGRAQLAATDYAAAFDSFGRAAGAGHVRAMSSSAAMLVSTRIDRTLHPLPLDEARAETLWRAAIAEGDPFAMHQLGRRLLSDGADEAARQEGFELVDRASELGHTFAMNNLGGYYSDTASADYQPGRARAYFTASAMRGDIYGIQGLGRMALEGHGSPPDPAGALAFFEEAAAGGHPGAPGAIGRLYSGEDLGKPDYPKAVGWLDTGLARGDAAAGNRAAFLIAGQDIPGLDEVDALIRAAKSGTLGSAPARDYAAGFLRRRPAATIDRALQRLLSELGVPVAEDGRVGRQTLAALDRLRQEAGIPGALPTDPAARLFLAAQIHWARNPVRVDLF